MTTTNPFAVVAAVLVATAGVGTVAATGTTTTVGTHVQADGQGSATDRSSASMNASEQAPPVEMPEQAPDRVATIHETIRAFLDGDVDQLGAALAAMLGAGPADAAGAAEAHATGAPSADAAGEAANASATGDLGAVPSGEMTAPRGEMTAHGPPADVPAQADDRAAQANSAVRGEIPSLGDVLSGLFGRGPVESSHRATSG